MAHLVSELLELMNSIRFYEVKQTVRLVVGVKDELKNLTDLLQSVKLEVAGAERRWWHEHDQKAKKWLDEFEEICYDLDDVLDEWVTAILKSETESASGNTSKSEIHFSCFTRGQRDDIASKIKKLRETAKESFGRQERPHFEKSIQFYATDSSTDETTIYGRQNEKEQIIKLLLREGTDPGGPSPKIISIVGKGEVGKTSLAQMVCKDMTIKAKFNLTIWVSISKAFAKIITEKSIFYNEPDVDFPYTIPERFLSSDRVDLNDVLEETSFAVTGQKFLLVLDGVQEIDSFMWDKYLKCYFEFGLPGSKVLITTRSDMVPVPMRDYTCLFTLHEIAEMYCWSLFRDWARFGNSSPKIEEMVNDIGNKFVSGCKGLPYLVKALESLLQFKISERERERVWESKAWNLDRYEDQRANPLLLLCYDDLPSKIKRCFTYCAVFSKDSELELEYWINLWMAQGYLRATQTKEAESIGKEYFQYLIARYFFQNDIKDGNGNTIACKMHDLVHEFAQFLTENECVNLEVNSDGVTGMVSSWDKVRHLKIEFTERNALFPVSFDNLKKLRSLFVDCSKSVYPNLNRNQHAFFRHLTCLRALKLSHIASESLSGEIGELIHLRYLDLSDNQHLKYLPEEIRELYNLQTLNLSGCCKLQRLPYGLSRLINLKHLNNYHTDKLTFMPRGIERLTSLKSLYKFVVSGSYHSNAFKNHSTLAELQNLNRLQKYLEITGLGISRDVISDARKASLKKKKHLVTLKLSFVEWRKWRWRINHDEEIIQALEPPPTLEHLKIEHFAGMKIPICMMQLAKLSKICISKCPNCDNLPPLGKLRFLEYLEISEMKSVQKVDDGFLGIEEGDETAAFPELKELRFSRMYAWKEWGWGRSGAEIPTKVVVMPSLDRLYIKSCDNLASLPTQLLHKKLLGSLAALRVLAVDDCRFLREKYHWAGGKDWSLISPIPIIKFDGERYSNQKQKRESVDKKAF